MSSLYKIKNWDKHFEGAQSKTYNNKTSCMMPTKHSLGYKKLINSKNGAALFGCWCALIQILSRHEKPRKGYCTDSGGVHGLPYTPEDLELLTGIPSEIFVELFPVVQSIGWVDFIKAKDSAGTPQEQFTDGILTSNLDLDLDSNLNSDLDSNSISSPSAQVSEGDTESSQSKQKAQAKKEEYTAAFEEFWATYPKKKGKGGAFRSWKRKKPDVAEVISAIEAQKNGFDWQKDGGQFIPHPQTWLNNSCWLDEASEPPPGSTAPINADNI